jgi:mannose-6-phosphate isomerase-like protein (cupin superfamily)
MKIARLSEFTNGWFLGNFNPSLFKSEDFEVCVKNFKKGENEAPHFQRIATEVTVVLSGSVRMGEHILQVDDILTVYKGEVCDFEALTDCKVLGVKFPSLPEDKVLA